MAKVLVTETHLEDIADSIRNKNGTGNVYRPSEMAAAIDAIQTAGDLGTKSITENGTYSAIDDSLDGYSEVTVNVPSDTLVSKTITANGTYDPADDSADGYSEVTVNVSGGGATILSGTNAPSDSYGANGNIYIQYNGAHVTSSGSQYLDTGVIVGSNIEFEIDFTTYNYIDSSPGTSGYGCIFGGRTGSNNAEMQISTYNHTSSGLFAYGSARYAAGLSRESRIFVSYHDGVYSVNGVESSIGTSSWTGTYSLYLFALNNAGIAAQYGTIDLYSFKIWQDGTLVKNYTPSEVNGVACLYDAVSDSYEYPTSGTLIYSDGGEISEVYVKVDGSWTELVGANISDVTT